MIVCKSESKFSTNKKQWIKVISVFKRSRSSFLVSKEVEVVENTVKIKNLIFIQV